MKKTKKAVLYLLATAALIGVAWWLQSGLEPKSAEPFLRALRPALGVGALLLAVGICRKHGADALFCGIVGGCTLLAGIVLFLLYGGMDDVTAAGTDMAFNLISCLWTALPLAFLVRTAVVTAAVREDGRRPLRAVRIAALALAVWFAVLLAAGQMLHFVHREPVDTPYVADTV